MLLESFLQILPRLIQRALSVVVGLQSLAILVGGAFALPGNVKDLAELDMAPNLGPARIAVAVERIPISVGGCLIVFLCEEHFGNTVVGERTVFVDLKGLVVFRQRPGK